MLPKKNETSKSSFALSFGLYPYALPRTSKEKSLLVESMTPHPYSIPFHVGHVTWLGQLTRSLRIKRTTKTSFCLPKNILAYKYKL